MSTLRIIGDVHGQITAEDLSLRDAQPYLDLIAEAELSIQIGDMGDQQTYDQLRSLVDPDRHRFFPGNHDHFPHLPPHCLGDFGTVTHDNLQLFFIRGAASFDKDRLIDLGKELGTQLWFEEEELSENQMSAAEHAYLEARPTIVLSHDAPSRIAELAWSHAMKQGPPRPGARFLPSRTNQFLTRLWEQHPPMLWIFGHHHRDWVGTSDGTQFICLGELSYLDLDSEGNVIRR